MTTPFVPRADGFLFRLCSRAVHHCCDDDQLKHLSCVWLKVGLVLLANQLCCKVQRAAAKPSGVLVSPGQSLSDMHSCRASGNVDSARLLLLVSCAETFHSVFLKSMCDSTLSSVAVMAGTQNKSRRCSHADSTCASFAFFDIICTGTVTFIAPRCVLLPPDSATAAAIVLLLPWNDRRSSSSCCWRLLFLACLQATVVHLLHVAHR